MDITKLTLEEAIQLKEQLESALPNLKKQRLKGLQLSIREMISTAGFTLDEVLTPMLQNKQEGKIEESTGRKPAAIKYRDGDKTWTGKGKPPSWLKAFEAAGGNRESLRVVAEESKKKTA